MWLFIIYEPLGFGSNFIIRIVLIQPGEKSVLFAPGHCQRISRRISHNRCGQQKGICLSSVYCGELKGAIILIHGAVRANGDLGDLAILR